MLRQRPFDKSATKDRGEDSSHPREAYASIVFQSLAVFRFFSFSLGVGLALTSTSFDDPPVQLLIVMLVVGLYNLYRVATRLNPSRYRPRVQWLILGIDVFLSLAVVLSSEGLDSGFLIYSLSPILTASLLMDFRHATAVAAVSALSISGGHVAAGLGLSELPWILTGSYLVFSLLYSAVCLLIGYLPFVANLNWQRRIRAESLASERRRLRSEVHDNVAQTLAFLSLKTRRAEQRATQDRGVLTSRDALEIRGAVERAYLTVRDYLDGSEEGRSDEPLQTRLLAVVSQWGRDTGLFARLSVTGVEGVLPPRVKHQLMQIAREALANVAKHAYSRRVLVELSATSGEVTLRIRDEGRGFSASQPRGHGMDIMAERSALAGASLTIDSAPGRGTEVVVIYPREPERGAS